MWVAEAGTRRASDLEVVLQQRRGPGLHGRERRDHPHRPLGPEARRDRARLVRRPGRATARSARTASSPTATTSTSPTAARPRLARRRADETSSCATRRWSPRSGCRASTGRCARSTRHGGHFKIADLWKFEDAEQPGRRASATRSSTPTRSTCTPTTGASSSPTRAATACCARTGGAASRRSAIFPNATRRTRSAAARRPGPAAIIPMQAVPTGVVKGPDGALYMSQLTGFPFPVGGANVFRIDPWSGQDLGLRDGVHEHHRPRLRQGRHALRARDGRDDSPAARLDRRRAAHRPLARQGAEAESALPAGTLTHPGGVAVGKRGDLYVTNRSDEADFGEVLKLDLG